MNNAWELLLAAASALVLLSSAIDRIAQAVRTAKAPNAAQDIRLDALEEWKKTVDNKLSKDNDRLTDIEESDRVIQRALLALLAHGIDGNNLKQMQDAKDDLQNHLINR